MICNQNYKICSKTKAIFCYLGRRKRTFCCFLSTRQILWFAHVPLVLHVIDAQTNEQQQGGQVLYTVYSTGCILILYKYVGSRYETLIHNLIINPHCTVYTMHFCKVLYTVLMHCSCTVT